MNGLSKIERLVSRQLKKCENNIKAFENRAGFFILPDEILSTVLEYAALMDYATRKEKPKEEHGTVITVKAATRLSHVCRRFRHLITHSSGLWNRVHNTIGDPDMVSLCFSRCKQAIAEVTLNTPLLQSLGARLHGYKPNNRRFIQTVLNNSRKCRSVILDGSEEHPLFHFEPRDGFLQDYSDLSKDIRFSNLTSLDVRYPQTALSSRVGESFHDAIHFYRSWSTPGLQSLAARNFIPIPFTGARSLTSLGLILNFDGYGDDSDSLDAGSLGSFLEQCPNLERLKLSLFHANKYTTSSVSKPVVVMPRLNHLDFSFIQCSDDALKAFFNVVRFENVTNMQLYISLLNQREHWHGALVKDVISAIFPNANVFPKLTDLSMNAHVDSYYDEELDAYVYDNFAIPFAAIPHVRHLALTTKLVEILPIPNALPAIRTLTIRDSDMIKRSWLAKFVKQVERQGDLDLLRLFVDGRCYALNTSGVKGALSKDDMLRLIADEDSE